MKQKDAEVVLGALGIEVPLAAGCGSTVEGLGGDAQAELQVGFDLSGMQGRLEPAELHRAPVPDVVQIHSVVAGVVVMLGLVVVVAVPDAVQLGLGLGPVPFDVSDQLFTDRSGVTAQAVAVDTKGMKDKWFLFVNHLGKVAQLASVKGFGVDMDVDAALAVDLSTGLADSPNHLLCNEYLF